MVEDLVEYERLAREGRGVRGVMRWRADHPRSTVWAALTQTDKLAQWLAPGAIDPRLGGAVTLAFEHSGVLIESRVTAFEPGRMLQYSWSGPGQPERPVRWTLSQDDPLIVTCPSCCRRTRILPGDWLDGRPTWKCWPCR